MKKIVQYIMFSCVLVIGIMSCNEDFARIESDIKPIQNFDTNKEIFPLIAYTKTIAPLRSNNLGNDFLGVYKDDYGTSTSNVVSQVSLSTYDPDFGKNPKIDSVIVSIPYFSTLTETDSDGNNIYQLDSVYNATKPIKFSIYTNTFFLRSTDPNSDDGSSQSYYTDSNSTINFDNHKGELLYQNNNFLPNSNEQKAYEVNNDGEVVESNTLTPEIRLVLDSDQTKTFWENTLFAKQDMPELSNDNNFKNYFRGLYFKTEAVNDDGHLALLNFSAANIVIYYKKDESETDNTRVNETFQINVNGVEINTYNNNYSIADGNPTEGDDVLNLKGLNGSMAIIDLFNGIVIDPTTQADVPAFEYFENNYKADEKDGTAKRLVNEANLVFHVKQDAVNNPEPERIYLMDLKNNAPLIDFVADPTGNDANPISSKIFHSEPLTFDSDGNGVSYKVRITRHINDIILQDSTNVKLGVFITSNINEVIPNINQVSTNGNRPLNLDIKEANIETDILTQIPLGSLRTPYGTKIYGSTTNTPNSKRLQLEIYYTEPN